MTDWYSKIKKMHQGMIAEDMESVKTNILPLPSPSLNWALGGGFVFGKITTVYGPEQSGKSLLAQLAIAELHKKDSKAWAIWYDAEYSIDKDYCKKLGIDLSRLWIIQSNEPKNIFDHFYDTVGAMIQEGFPLKIMVIDSVKSIQGPKEAALESVEKHVMGDVSQLLPKAFKRILGTIRTNKILTILVQQVTEEFDERLRRRGVKWHVPSGQALKHASDQMILLEKVEAKASKMFDETYKNIQKLPIQIGHTVRAKVEKNRTDCPHLVAEFRLKYGVGVVDVALEIATLAVSLGIVTKPNVSTYCFKDVKIHGFDKFVEKIKSQPELYIALEKAIKEFDVFASKDESIGMNTAKALGELENQMVEENFDDKEE